MICIPAHLVARQDAAQVLALACSGRRVTLTTRPGAYLVGSDGKACTVRSAAAPHGGLRVGEGYALVGDRAALRHVAASLGAYSASPAGLAAIRDLAARIQSEIDYLELPTGEVAP